VSRLLAWLGLALLAAFVVFLGGAGPGTVYADRRMVVAIATAILLGTWAFLAWRDASWRPRSVLAPLIAVGLVSLAISTLFSRDLRVSAEYLAFAVVLAALYLLLVQLFARPFFRVRLFALASMLFLIISVAYVVAVVIRWVIWWNAVGGVRIPPLRPEFESLTFGNPSHVLMMVALLAVPAAAGVSWATRRGAVWVVTVLGLAAVVALLSGSRAGWLALAIAGVFGLALIAVLVGPALRSFLRTSPVVATRRFRLAVVGCAAVLLVPAAVLAPAILRRASEGGEDLRLSYVTIALRMFQESPIVGTGLGTWVVQRIAYTLPPETDYYIPHAHNVYAQTLAEQGIVGAIAGLIVIAGLTWLVRDAIRSDGTRRQVGIATAIGLVYFAAHQALDFNVNLPSVLIALALPIAYLDSTSTRSLPVARDLRLPGLAARGFGAALALATAFAVGGLTWQELPALDNDRAISLANEGDWAAALAPATSAAATDPDIMSFAFTAALAEARAGNHLEAARLFRQVAEHNDLPEAWLNLAAEDYATGNVGAVEGSLAEAMRLGYQRPAVAMPAGDLALRIGADDLAIDAFTAAVVVSPALLADPWWEADAARAALRSSVAQAAMRSGGGWELALMSGDIETAKRLAGDESTKLFIAAWSGEDAARDQLVAKCRAEPLDILRLLLCARAEGRVGNLEAANEFRYIADAQIGGAYSVAAELRVATRELVGRTLEGNPAIFWGTFTYRRPSPWDMLVPSVIHLTLE
jgi:O-antigen ligase/tetratricopeptide (TPR) repeat protein